ncbi:MAG: T9SS type A sorting domain-containing protein [Lewinellaceae bacterium]|nr:T9SS type A sorting domain-containing protein [Lewinellaceae bacterium]
MRLLTTCMLAFLCLSSNALQGQVSKDVTVPLTATISVGPASITLNWPNPGNADLLILRRTKGQAGNEWIPLLNVIASNLSTLTDTAVVEGQIYEYAIRRSISAIDAFGYAHVALNASPVDSRGKILIFVDSATADSLGVELVRLKNDLRGDGWWPIPFHTDPSSTVQSIKDQIVASYNADPLNVKAVLLLGAVPIPYSGEANWDNQTDHLGAWPSDAYYGDVNGIWTDVSVNNTTPARAANDNIPGDGKFDQSFLPSLVELQVGRVDFRRINAPAFGAADHIGLMKRYLDKNHDWRIGDYTVDNKAIVDDNLGFSGGEAFAADGFRNAYPLVGEANVVQADFFNDSDPDSYLLGYGCGAGNYTQAQGVGSSANFATETVNIVFSNLFGAYFGDWDFETNPFMPSALASRGGILTCSWAGRPHWFSQALASCETIGYSTRETMNTQFNNGFFYSPIGESGAYVALLGDPTLRANVVKPATNLTVSASNCTSVELNWTASADVVTGYHVYRALSQDGPYTLLTNAPITGTTYTDNAAPGDTLYYQVRAIKNVTNPGGGTYANNAIGPIKSIVFSGVGGPTITTTGDTANCTNGGSVFLLTANSNGSPISSWSWVGPNGFTSNEQNPLVTDLGTYTVTATAVSGCSSTATASLVGDFDALIPVVTISNSVLTCANPTTTVSISPAGYSSAFISGPGGFHADGFSAVLTQPGSYTFFAYTASNGCLGPKTFGITSDMAIPSVTVSNSGNIDCTNSSSELMASSNVPGVTFEWFGPCLNGTTASCGGTYTVTVTNPINGCSNAASTIVEADVTLPTVIAQDGIITCDNPTMILTANWTPANAVVQWNGPCVISGFPPMASCAGIYTVVVTNPDNGCSSSTTALIVEDVVLQNFDFPPPALLTCDDPCVTFTAPNSPGMEIYVGAQLVPSGTSIQLCQPGTYIITVRSIGNGCTATAEFVIMQDATIPIATAVANGMISCNVPAAQLSSAGSSSGPNIAMLWTGPGGFTFDIPNPQVFIPGIYTLLVTNTQNGCTASTQVEVFSDGSVPVVNATASGQLNCSNQSVQLNSGNSDPGASYNWTGPNGFVSTLPNPTVSVPGNYMVVVTVGTCNAAGGVMVTMAPALVVTSLPTEVDCDGFVEACVNASGGTAPYTYLWSNGSTESCATFIGGGTFTVLVSDVGGCFVTITQSVVVSPPLSGAFTIDEDCDGTSELCLFVNGGVPPYSIAWSNGDVGECTTIISGVINGTITDAVGCFFVLNDLNYVSTPAIAVSGAVTNESATNANDGAIDLTPSGGTGLFAYLWSNGATTQDINGLSGGTYTVTVTDADTPCTATSSFTVTTTSSTEEAALFEQFLLSPNPTTGLALLSLKMHEAANIRVEIHDLAGRLIWVNPSLKTEVLDLSIDLTQSPAGMYSLSVWVENQVFIRKMAVVR